jgi:5'-nucleotidase
VSGSNRPRVVVTNDDGIGSEGLRALAEVLVRAGLDVLVAAPDGEASGSGTSMTAERDDGRIVTRRTELPGLPQVRAYALRAAPAFIAVTALRGGLGPAPDLLVSGINLGPNTGRFVLHSGTVGAAMAAAQQGVRAAAFSLDVRSTAPERHWATAAHVAEQVVAILPDLEPGLLLNVNIPNVPPAGLRGIRTGHLATRGAVAVSYAATDDEFLTVTLAESGERPEPGSDSALLAAGFASVTPFRPVCETSPATLPWAGLPE